MRALAAALALPLLVAVAGCGGGGGHTSLIVSAAASLEPPFTSYGARFDAAEPRFSFAGSDELAAQIRQGARPDLYAAANTALPEALRREALVERPVAFASNRLVLAVPAGSPMRSLTGAERSGAKVVIGSPGVPVGSYTRQVLDRLPARERRGILANVRSQEPDVTGVVAKVAERAADAGFVYVTDVIAARGRLRAVELPRRLRPQVRYAAAVVRGARHRGQATRFLTGLLRGAGRAALRRAGFGPP